MAKKKAPGIYLVHNDGVELHVLGGPYTAGQLEDQIVKALRSGKVKQEHTFHTLEILAAGKPKFGEFSGGFIDEMQDRADAEV